jgi:hypothetical protein
MDSMGFMNHAKDAHVKSMIFSHALSIWETVNPAISETVRNAKMKIAICAGRLHAA